MKVIVTGALGHIGSHLIREIPKKFKNCEIILLDNLSTQRYGSLFNLPKSKKFKFINDDLNSLDLNKLFNKINYVIHLAAITDATWSLKNSKLVESNNYLSTKKVAEACAYNKCKLIFISSTSVYGTQKKTVDEECSESELKPQSPYAETKLKEEKLLKKISSKKDLNYVILRFGTIFGISPGMRFHTAVNKFCLQASISNPITIWKTAYQQKRPYLDVEDASSSICFIIKKKLFDKEIYNILTGNYTVGNIVKEIKKNKKNIKILFVKSKIMNQLSYEVLNKKIISQGFVFKGNLKKGIKNTINLLKNLS